MRVSISAAVVRPRASSNQRKKFSKIVRHACSLDEQTQLKLARLKELIQPGPAWLEVLAYKQDAKQRRLRPGITG